MKDLKGLQGPKCYDWSEKSYHMAGKLGKVVTRGLMELEWIKKSPENREVIITDQGKENLCKYFELQFLNGTHLT